MILPFALGGAFFVFGTWYFNRHDYAYGTGMCLVGLGASLLGIAVVWPS